MPKDRSKIGTSTQENFYQLSKTIQGPLTSNCTVWITTTMELSWWQLAVSQWYVFMTKLRGRRWLSWRNPMLLTIAIPIGSIVPSLIRTRRVSIWCILVDGTKLWLLGILGRGSLLWAFLDPTSAGMALHIAALIFSLPPGDKAINFSNGSQGNASWMRQ